MSDRQLSDPLRFLLRALAFLALMLALWWLLLLNPLLAGLRLAAESTLRLLPGGSVSHVTIGPDRNWTFQVPAPAAVVNQEKTQQMLGAAAAGAGRIKIRSMKVEGAARYPILFTVSLPLFWAILLAAPGWRRRLLLRMACGTAVLAILALLSVAVYAFRLVGGYFQLTTGGLAGFLTDSAVYLAVGVVPYLSPVLVALSLDGDLRYLILAGEAEPAAEPAAAASSSALTSAAPAAPRRRRRR